MAEYHFLSHSLASAGGMAALLPSRHGHSLWATQSNGKQEPGSGELRCLWISLARVRIIYMKNDHRRCSSKSKSRKGSSSRSKSSNRDSDSNSNSSSSSSSTAAAATAAAGSKSNCSCCCCCSTRCGAGWPSVYQIPWLACAYGSVVLLIDELSFSVAALLSVKCFPQFNHLLRDNAVRSKASDPSRCRQ